MTAPFDRSAAIARVGFLMPGLTDVGLQCLVGRAELLAKMHPRDLTPATLAAEQRAREAPAAEGEIHSALCRVRAVRQVLPGETLADACRREVAAERVPMVAECFARAEASGTLVAKGAPTEGVEWVKPAGPCPLCAGAGRPGGWPCGACGRC